MIDETKLLDLCKDSIKERMECFKSMCFGFGWGITTQLKKQIAELTQLDFEHIRHAINNFDKINNWDHTDLSCDKWDIYADFINRIYSKETGRTETYFIEEFGHLLQKYLLKWVRLIKQCECDSPRFVFYSNEYICHNKINNDEYCNFERSIK